MDSSFVVRLFGFPATLIHHDLLVLDRWLWVRRRLPRTRNGERLIDIGCGTGSFTIGAARRGYVGVGLSWDRRNQRVAAERAALCKVHLVEFPIQDVRVLDKCTELRQAFEVAICLENIEHVLDDRKLMHDIYDCLKPGGMLLLTTPNYFYRAITSSDNGPFSRTEDGGHVRRGYTSAALRELCAASGFLVEEISSCSGFFSQKLTAFMRILSRHSLSAAEPEQLAAIVADRNRPRKHVERARVVLASADRHAAQRVAQSIGVSRPTMWRWQQRFAESGLPGLLRDKNRVPPPGSYLGKPTMNVRLSPS